MKPGADYVSNYVSSCMKTLLSLSAVFVMLILTITPVPGLVQVHTFLKITTTLHIYLYISLHN